MAQEHDWYSHVAQTLSLDVAQLNGDGPRVVVDVESESWLSAAVAVRDRLGCGFFDWLSAVDEAEDGMRMVAHLWNLDRHRGVLLRTMLPASDLVVDSLVSQFPGAAWHERETHEMFGVDFCGNEDLRPLLLPSEFRGHPLRKDFVLVSRVVKQWPGEVEPGGGRPAAKPSAEADAKPSKRPKRAPKRPLGVPDDPAWGKLGEPMRHSERLADEDGARRDAASAGEDEDA
ncbi:NADH-quinone oxidoreductase subunit C [Natronoglycomyces albus]|uniref:NADH-quinone oxidoreductase subunit C n=1 Tax=Natronoglycomyces albus TaxID=2811108 RepID=A0A895XMD0_9ACTN|nr:NADH-quinone oxidoreductase subunit C [Natronoglycomyces albus]QSB04693.1 NADH-quinone oxidoreductase subunit C [Natronoglycomyces albus]